MVAVAFINGFIWLLVNFKDIAPIITHYLEPVMRFVIPAHTIFMIAFVVYKKLTGKKSYKEAMKTYNNSESHEVAAFQQPLALDDLLTPDGEIPDYLLKDKTE